MRSALLVLLASSTAFAEPSLVGKYTCQIGRDGVQAKAYPCEIIASADGPYLRFSQAKVDPPCLVVGMITHRKQDLVLDGSVSCDFTEPDVIGREAVFAGKLATSSCGFHFDDTVDLVTTHVLDPKSTAIPRATRLEHKKTHLQVEVCRLKAR